MMDIDDMEHRVTVLERSRYRQIPDHVKIDPAMRRARQHVEEAELHSAYWKFVPKSYYNWPLQQRGQYLGSPVPHLCKSLLMENKKAPQPEEEESMDRTNPRFVLVVIQYASTLQVKKLSNAIRKLRSSVADRLELADFDWRIASSADNARLTGYLHNAVTPFGMHALQGVPIMLSAAVVPLHYLWLGGGHAQLKLGVSVADFCAALNPVTADITEPRPDFDALDDDGPELETTEDVSDHAAFLQDTMQEFASTDIAKKPVSTDIGYPDDVVKHPHHIAAAPDMPCIIEQDEEGEQDVEMPAATPTEPSLSAVATGVSVVVPPEKTESQQGSSSAPTDASISQENDVMMIDDSDVPDDEKLDYESSKTNAAAAAAAASAVDEPTTSESTSAPVPVTPTRGAAAIKAKMTMMPSPGNINYSPGDPRLQNIMQQRKKMVDAASSGAMAAPFCDLESPKKRDNLKTVGMSADLQAIMAKRRAAYDDNAGA